jgi:hypothetical protein
MNHVKNQGRCEKRLDSVVKCLVLGWPWVGLRVPVHAASFMSGQKWFLFFFCLLASDLGLFCEQLLAVLKNGKSGGSNKS